MNSPTPNPFPFLLWQATKGRAGEGSEYPHFLLEYRARRPCTTILWVQHGELASRKIY